jgi:hypothetical protein
MYITTYFASQGVPATGLTPTIKIRDLSDNSVVINSVAMSEVGDGFYKYNFAAYDAAKDYAIRCDGGNTLSGADRYTISSTETMGLNDKTGFSLSATGADLILKSSTFIQAIVAAVNELATYGLTALNTLLVTTGIKAATVPAVTVTTNNDKTGYALSSTGADLILKSSTFIQAIVAAINELATYGLTALNTLLVTTGIKAATVPAVTVTTNNDKTGYSLGTAPPTAVAIRQEIDSNSTQIAAIVADTNELQTDLVNGGRLDLLIDGIKAKTDTIPTSPATEATLATIIGYIDTEVAAIKAVTDKLDAEVTDATVLEAGSLLDRLRVIGWILRNKMVVTDANGNTVIYKDDGVTPAFNVHAALTDVMGITTRERLL